MQKIKKDEKSLNFVKISNHFENKTLNSYNLKLSRPIFIYKVSFKHSIQSVENYEYLTTK